MSTDALELAATLAVAVVCECGALMDEDGTCAVEECDCRKAAKAALAAQPVSQAGEVAEIIHRLNEGTHDGYGDDLMREAADLLAAQAAEIERLKGSRQAVVDSAHQFCRDLEEKDAAIAAKDAEIARLKTAIGAAAGDVICWHNQAEQALSRQQELEAALRPFTEMANSMDHCRRKSTVVLISGESDGRFGQWPVLAFRRARAALAPAGKEPEQP